MTNHVFSAFIKFLFTMSSECQEALGMEDGAISDAQISASSQWDANHAAKQGRLHCNQHAKVTRVATQGRNAAYSQWVTKYKLQYSDDGVNFQYYQENGAIKVSYAFFHEINLDYIFNSRGITSTFIYKRKTLKPIELFCTLKYVFP